MRYDPTSFNGFDRLAYSPEKKTREPVFKGKFLVCVRHSAFLEPSGEFMAYHDQPNKDFSELERDEYILFSRN